MGKLVDLGGGWFERPDGEKVQLRKEEVEAYEASLEEASELGKEGSESGAPGPSVGPEVVRLEETAPSQRGADPLESLPSPPPVNFPSGIDEGAQTGESVNVRDLPPVPGSQLPIGPFNDYAFVTTPWGEFGIPKGQQIVQIEEIRDIKDPEKISYKAILGGTQYARTGAERAEWLRKTEAERRANS